MAEALPARRPNISEPSLSRRRHHKRCDPDNPDARIYFNAQYGRWTVEIMPQCHVKTFRSQKEAHKYAGEKKAELADSPNSRVVCDNQIPIIEV